MGMQRRKTMMHLPREVPRDRMKKVLRAPLIVCVALGALIIVTTATPVVSWSARALAGDLKNPKGDILIVLGGGTVGKDQMLNLTSYRRALYAVYAWRGGGFREVVVSGQGVAPRMRDFMSSYGVPADSMRIENRSLTTRENALFTKQTLLKTPGRSVLLTSDFHMFRALRAFRKAGVRVEPRPLPDALQDATSWQGRWQTFFQLSLEIAKIGYYYARGWI
jgi:uncharacterized SAM-binding protein YcdF (DUF218 family)